MDQQEIENLLVSSGYEEPQFGAAQNVYENGAHSKSYAVLSVLDGLTTSIVKGTPVTGESRGGDPISGTVYSDAEANAMTLEIQYDTEATQASYSTCQWGGSSEPVKDGCTFVVILLALLRINRFG